MLAYPKQLHRSRYSFFIRKLWTITFGKYSFFEMETMYNRFGRQERERSDPAMINNNEGDVSSSPNISFLSLLHDLSIQSFTCFSFSPPNMAFNKNSFVLLASFWLAYSQAPNNLQPGCLPVPSLPETFQQTGILAARNTIAANTQGLC